MERIADTTVAYDVTAMQNSGLSDEVRIVRGVPLRLRQNRDDTSWAEEYSVRATTPLPPLGVKPKVFDGPWEQIGVVRPEPAGSATWTVTFSRDLEGQHPRQGPERSRSFNDALGALAERWRAHWMRNHPASGRWPRYVTGPSRPAAAAASANGP